MERALGRSVGWDFDRFAGVVEIDLEWGCDTGILERPNLSFLEVTLHSWLKVWANAKDFQPYTKRTCDALNFRHQLHPLFPCISK